MDGTPSEGHAAHAQLHQRILNRAATFAEGAQLSTPGRFRRRSSLVSNFSDTRHSFQSSTDNLLRPSGKNDMDRHTPPDGSTHWNTLPVVVAIMPAIIGLTVENGAVHATDFFILLLAGWFLHWSVRIPWEWYHEAQQRRYECGEGDNAHHDDIIHEEYEDDVGSLDERPESVVEESRPPTADGPKAVTNMESDAVEELKRAELFAFAGCFFGPLLGALLMHTIRGQLMRVEGIVSDANLTIFLLSAEILPVNRLIKMRTERIVHLQRVVRLAPRDDMRPADAQQISQRLADLEARLDGPVAANNNNEVDVMKLSAEVRQTTQLQLDALNRAVRRYEKRHMAQSIQIEARFRELEVRLKDALALAAAAARTGQQPGIVVTSLSWIASVISCCLQIAWDIAMYPLRTAAMGIGVVKSMFVNDERQARRRGKGPLNGHSGISTPRMQSRSGR